MPENLLSGAAYIRVSTDKQEELGSLTVEYLKKLSQVA